MPEFAAGFVATLMPQRDRARVVALSGEFGAGEDDRAIRIRFDIHGDKRTISINGEEKD